MSDGWGLPMRDERPRLFSRFRAPDTGDWWLNQGGEWRRTTPHGDTTDRLFDRMAEDYVAGRYRDVEGFEAALERAVGKYGLGARTLGNSIEATQRMHALMVLR